MDDLQMGRLDKTELLARIHRARLALEDEISALSEEQLTTPASNGWSIKDHLAHLATWELGIAELLGGRPRFEAMQVEEAVSQGKSEEAVNELIYRQHADLSLSQIMEKFKDAHHQLLETLEALDDEDLYKSYASFVPEGGDLRQDPVINWVIGNTYEHFDEHRGYIRAVLQELPAGLSEPPKDVPAPVDDGAVAHLKGWVLPDLTLPSTGGDLVNLTSLAGRWVLYIYPMTGRPGVPLPDGWDGIPGARGCTPQACSFRDHYGELKSLNTGVFGLSAQSADYQREARDRLHLPFELLSDSSLQLKERLRLPTFTVEEKEFFKRLTLIVEDGRIVKVFYPVFPPERNVDDVLAWLQGDAELGAEDRSE